MTSPGRRRATGSRHPVQRTRLLIRARLTQERAASSAVPGKGRRKRPRTSPGPANASWYLW